MTARTHRPGIARLRGVLWATALLALTASLLTTPGALAQDGAADPPPRPQVITIETVSSRADVVSGDEALVEVRLPAGVEASGLTLALEQMPTGGSTDVTASMTDMGDGRLLGVVTGLPQGDSRIRATAEDGSGAVLDLTVHPATGPIFSGPQVQPWFCSTEDAGLGAPDDAETCHVDEPVESFHYMSVSRGDFAAYDPDSPPPDGDVATTTTDQGEEVPYIVRVETGTLNRGVYDVAVLYDPAQEFTPTSPQAGWNNKVLYLFGGGCAPDHNQDAGGEDVLNDMALSRGFAVASSSLNVLGNNCNIIVSAEMVSMVKERMSEAYGPIRHTIGQGCSGGSIQQHGIAANYPGLLDGIRPECSYPDVWSIHPELFECELLLPYFRETSPQLWLDLGDQTAVVGHQSTSSCDAWVNGFGFPRSVGDPTTGCNHLTLPAQTLDPTFSEPDHAYDPDDNPDGTRCTLWDYISQVFGVDADTGQAPRPWDNTGVQYGLNALLDGTITPEQFVDLNVSIGGLDEDYVPQAERMQADSDALAAAYRSGLISHGRHLAEVPIIDIRGSSNAEIHTDVQTPAMRDRLIKHNGHADNWLTWNSPGPLVPHPPIIEDSFLLMDEWLTAIEADTSDTALADKVITHRPEAAVDACYLSGQKVTDMAQCEQALPSYETPRIAAGGPLSGDIMKCALTPFDPSAYGDVEFTDEQQAVLGELFSSGVCDWTEQGAGEQAPKGGWQSFADGPNSNVLGDAPVSVPFGPAEVCTFGEEGKRIVRLDDADPVALGLALATACPGTPDVVVLARDDDFADALAASGLAGALNAPVLLTAAGALDQRVADQLAAWETVEVIIAGGPKAIAPAVADALGAQGITVTRVFGETRIQTAAQLGSALADRAETAIDRVILATGDNFPDALTAGVAAGAGTDPVLLTSTASLHPATADALRELLGSTGEVLIAGGPAAISAQVEDAVRDLGYTIARAQGPTRYETAVALNQAARSLGAGTEVLMISSGEAAGPALVAGPAALRTSGSMLLAPTRGLSAADSVSDYLAAIEASVGTVVLVGDETLLDAGLEDELESLGYTS